MIDDVLLDTLDRLRGTGAEFDGFLANHGPMAAEAPNLFCPGYAVPAVVRGWGMTGAPVRAWTALVRDDVHGPLPVLLLMLTTATGVVDAVSILGLGLS